MLTHPSNVANLTTIYFHKNRDQFSNQKIIISFFDFRFSLCWVFAVYDIHFGLFLILYIWTKFSHPLTLFYYHPPTHSCTYPSVQTSANRGPDSRFVLEASFKPLIPKTSQSSIVITLNCVHTNYNF